MAELEDVAVVDRKYQMMPEPEGEERQRSKLIVKLTEKGIEYRFSSLENRRRRLHNQLMRKSSAAHDLLYSKDYCTTMKEELQIFDDLFTEVLLLRDEYLELFGVEDFRLQEFQT